MVKKIFMGAMLAGMFTIACGGDECEDAADKLKECLDISGGHSSGGDGDGDCSGSAECTAKCVNDASCSQIKAATTEGEDNSYAKCLVKCSS